ncbi:hypothetical protein CVO96_19620 [Deinococcus koreensis]|uniref:Uncharacterized protein n=1 Tax=Deinococcus koreensis TaxID=2054903 RepID=A0A2K3US50_9DEIO|nr:hypothetical protein CVO96_19620 [Deinococcus koreensis]
MLVVAAGTHPEGYFRVFLLSAFFGKSQMLSQMLYRLRSERGPLRLARARGSSGPFHSSTHTRPRSLLGSLNSVGLLLLLSEPKTCF